MKAVIVGIDHAQLAAPPGCEAEGRRFFGELLGLAELPKPPALAVRGGLWFQCGAQQLHVGVEQDFRPVKKAHPALRLLDEAATEDLEARLRAAGVAVRRDVEIAGQARFFADDPWGNRLEFVAAKAARARPRALVEAWVEAFNAADVERLASFYAEDAVNHQVAEAPVRGRDAIRRMFVDGFATAKMVCIVESLFEEGDWAILEWRDPKGLRGCGFFQVTGGLIVLQRGYWDKLTFLREQGLPLPKS